MVCAVFRSRVCARTRLISRASVVSSGTSISGTTAQPANACWNRSGSAFSRFHSSFTSFTPSGKRSTYTREESSIGTVWESFSTSLAPALSVSGISTIRWNPCSSFHHSGFQVLALGIPSAGRSALHILQQSVVPSVRYSVSVVPHSLILHNP